MLLASEQVDSLVKSAVDKFGSETINKLANNAGVAFDINLIMENSCKTCLSSSRQYNI